MASSRLTPVGRERSRPLTLVDSCVPLDLMTDDPTWADWSESELARVQDEGPVVINPSVYAEVSAALSAIEELDEVLPAEAFGREPLPYEAGFLAGKAFLQYRRRGGQKTAPLPDFYIGAHAAVRGHRLLTRDATRYRTYFPIVSLICP
ncbi:type II toxin-antitoxin system VapC family toxin [Kitasatospora griseola]|uniref:type II toxin-antitoxin system VapC family toxin n=1 Tax=Kitasatospora griseola TaxID=2064 RepID=UPI0036DA6AC9